MPCERKVEAVNYAKINGNRAAGQKYDIDGKRIDEWRKNKNKIGSLMSMKKEHLRNRLDGAGV